MNSSVLQEDSGYVAKPGNATDNLKCCSGLAFAVNQLERQSGFILSKNVPAALRLKPHGGP
jgi:hypothetical protein